MKRNHKIHVLRVISISLPTGLFLWVLLLLINPIFERVYVLLILQPVVYIVVELLLYLRYRNIKKSKEMKKETSPITKNKDEEHDPPVNGQSYYKLREMTPEEEWAYLYLMYY